MSYDAAAPWCRPGWQARLAEALRDVPQGDLGAAWNAFWDVEGFNPDYVGPGTQMELAIGASGETGSGRCARPDDDPCEAIAATAGPGTIGLPGTVAPQHITPAPQRRVSVQWESGEAPGER